MDKKIILLFLLIASFALAIYSYMVLPEIIVTHWNAEGIPNGSMKKSAGLALFPGMSLFLAALALFLPNLDPIKKNKVQIKEKFMIAMISVIVFMIALQALVLAWNLGKNFNLMAAMLILFSALFLILGIVIKDVKRNWFIGIRTPWTLESDSVWKDTHKFAGHAFMISSGITLFGLIFTDLAIWFMLIPVSLTAIISTIYSYVRYKKETAKENH